MFKEDQETFDIDFSQLYVQLMGDDPKIKR